MKAASSDKKDLSELKFPLYGTPKIDGIRCVMVRGKAMSSSLKPIPNKFIRKTLKGLPPFDGELTVGTNFQDCTSGIMTHGGKPDFMFRVFDQVPAIQDIAYRLRRKWLITWRNEFRKKKTNPRIKFLIPVKLRNLEELQDYLGTCLAKGYEGIVVRSGKSPYKYGKSTWKEGWAIKFKPFADAEAKILWLFEQQENQNKKTKNELGLSQRKGSQKNFKGKNTLGGFHVTTKQWGEFNVGTGVGLNDALRKKIWRHPKRYIGKTIKFKYQVEGTKDVPRIPIFIGFRDERDV